MYKKDGTADLNSMPISQYPLRVHFKGLVNEFDNINLLSKKWISSQDFLNLDNKIKFYKTHHVMCNFGKNSFTNYQNTFGVIYIVRDPRNVITSILNYYSKKNYEEAKEFLFDEGKIIGVDLSKKNEYENDNNIITLISSWKNHYNSWKNFKKNFLLIKYENLINDERNEFLKIRNYLEEKLNLKFSDNKFDTAINSNSFSKLKKIEETEGFSENVKIKTKPEVNFFNLGPKNDYKNLLDEKISKEIENIFHSEMKELGYI
tara:strand:- start:678 stop:1460 length:783 start_codon:yes stop_codon:yes gene_type:complete